MTEDERSKSKLRSKDSSCITQIRQQLLNSKMMAPLAGTGRSVLPQETHQQAAQTRYRERSTVVADADLQRPASRKKSDLVLTMFRTLLRA
jgi:hypothetical protein